LIDLVEREAQHIATEAVAMSAILRLSVEEPLPGVRAIMVVGELDMLSAPTLQRCVQEELADGISGLILDLDKLTFIGSAGILVLVQTRDAAQRAQVPLRLVCNLYAVLRTLKICGVLDQFDIFDTLSNAIGGYRRYDPSERSSTWIGDVRAWTSGITPSQRPRWARRTTEETH
jgi:anti-sigma B factor antagonist